MANFKPKTKLPFNYVSNLAVGKHEFVFSHATTLEKTDKNGNPLELAHGTVKKEPASGLIQRIDVTTEVEMIVGSTYALWVASGSNSYNRGVVAV
jgi:hypothetical protein